MNTITNSKNDSFLKNKLLDNLSLLCLDHRTKYRYNKFAYQPYRRFLEQ